MKYTLVADGSSDKILLPILTWSLKQYTAEPIVEQWADFSRIPRQEDQEAKLRAALDLYPCNVLFIHRDAEGQSAELRRSEIATNLRTVTVRHIPVVPVRMTEAWFLLDELPIRSAAGNPSGTEDLLLPAIQNLESLPNPKRVLHDALVRASGHNKRRRARFPTQQRMHLIPHYIEDYSRLQVLPAFQSLQRDIRNFIEH